MTVALIKIKEEKGVIVDSAYDLWIAEMKAKMKANEKYQAKLRIEEMIAEICGKIRQLDINL